MIFRLSGGHVYDAPEGSVLLEIRDEPVANVLLAIDHACEGEKARRLVEEMGMTPVVPPKANRKAERETCKLRHEVERLFRRLKGCQSIFTRFDKLDLMFPSFRNFALIVETIYDLA